MRLWHLVSRWLFFSPGTPSRPHHPQLYPLDIDAIARELDLESEARKLAEAGLPGPEQTVVSAAESKAVRRVEKARQDYVEWGTFRLGIINESLARRDVRPLVNRALHADESFKTKAAVQVTQSAALVNELLANARAQQTELDAFRSHHGLTRSATYPEGSATFARYAVLLALIVCEGAANAYFFAQGMESGLIGGFVGAALFATLNLVLAFVIGKFLVPFCFHRNAALKTAGVLAIAFAIVSISGIGLTIAHFRDALMVDGSEPAKFAWAALQSAPLSLHDVNSWVLFLVSVLFAAVALFDGLTSDDRYPGYGHLDRRAKQSRDEYFGELEAIHGELEELKQQELDRLDANVRNVRSTVRELHGLIEDKEAAGIRFAAALLDAENCLDALMKIFRDVNAMHRGGNARPMYFDWRPGLQELVLPDFGTEENRLALSEQQKLVDELMGRVEALRTEIEACFTAHANMLKAPDDLAARDFAA